MKLDLTKIVPGEAIYLEKKDIVIDGIIRIKERVIITCLPNLSPYKELGIPNPWKLPYTYVDHKNAVDFQFVDSNNNIIKTVPIYAEVDGTLYDDDSSGDGHAYFVANGKKINFSHLSALIKGSHKKGDIIAYTGNVGTTSYHLHVYLNTNGDRSKDTILKIEYGGTAPETTTPPTSTTKTFKAVRSGKSQDNGTFYFDEKYYNDFKDGKQSASAVDTNGNTWAKDTTWTNVYSPSGSTSSEVKSLTYYYSSGWQKESSSDFVPFKSNDPDLVKENDTAKYGSGAYRLTTNKNGWLKDTRFK